MTGILNLLMGTVRSAVVADPYFEYTTLLLPGNGPNLKNNNEFLDSSANAFTITRNPLTGPNAPTQGTFSPFSQTGWGNYLSGSSQYLTVADSTDFDLTSDYTIELWFYPNVTGGLQRLFMIGDYRATYNGIDLYVNASNQVVFYSNGASIITGGTITNFQWSHVALVRNGGGANNTTLYINGTSVGQATNTTSFTGVAANGVSIGLEYSGAGTSVTTAMYVSNARLVKGTPVYTSNFTPPTSPLTAITNTVLLTCQSNRFVDANTQVAAKTITANGSPTVVAFSPFNPTASWSAATYGGSGYFDGSGDYLSAASNAAFGVGSGDFTIELWVYLTANFDSSGRGLISAAYDTNFAVIGVNSGAGNKIDFYVANTLLSTGTNYIALNTWTHLALVRSSGTTKIYFDGVEKASSGSLTGTGAAAALYVGTLSHATANVMTGYLSSTRLVKGTAVYTGAFTPPSLAPLTTAGSTSAASYPSTTNVNTSFASSATSLLLNFTNAGIYDATSKNDLETVGNAQISTTQSKWGGSSMSFDGTGDYLLAPVDANPYYNFGTGDFTVECWFYANSLSATDYAALLGCNNAGAGNNEWAAYVRSNGIFFYGSSGTLTGVAGTINTGTWYHYAASRSGNTLRIFLNGTQTTSATVTGSYTNSAVGLRVGDDPVGSNPAFNGYLQDVRITKGYARYTANFTAPTAAFPTL